MSGESSQSSPMHIGNSDLQEVLAVTDYSIIRRKVYNYLFVNLIIDLCFLVDEND